jgi:predicted TIM-barrel enzyme
MLTKVKIPVVIGSGVDPNNIRDLWNISDAFIVGSYIKKDGHWAQELDVERIKTLINVVKQLRKCPPPA